MWERETDTRTNQNPWNGHRIVFFTVQPWQKWVLSIEVETERNHPLYNILKTESIETERREQNHSEVDQANFFFLCDKNPFAEEEKQKWSWRSHSWLMVTRSSSRQMGVSWELPSCCAVVFCQLMEAPMAYFLMLGYPSAVEWSFVVDFFLIIVYCGASRVMSLQWWMASTYIPNF